MSRLLPLQDFRARRKVLVRSDFAYAPNPPRRPSDRIDRNTWHHLMVLPDDVAIRTSNHHGTELQQFTELTGAWIESVDMHTNPRLIDPVMLDAFDDLKAGIFNSLFGWYRFSIAGMRNVLELMAIGCWADVCQEKQKFTDWQDGKIALSLGQACDGLIHGAAALEAHLENTVGDNLFSQKTAKSDGGFLRRAFSGISEYSHSRPGHTHGHMWESNGPTYVPSAFQHVAWINFETIALSFALAMLAKPSMHVPKAVVDLVADQERVKSRITPAAFAFLHKP